MKCGSGYAVSLHITVVIFRKRVLIESRNKRS